MKLSSAVWHVYTDGASRGNPGLAGAGIYVTKQDTILINRGIYLGKRTNNQAEYLALALALFFIKNKNSDQQIQPTQLIIKSDSELLIKQMLGIYRVKNPILKTLQLVIETLIEPYEPTFMHIRRELNTDADRLANEGIENKTEMPIAFTKLID